MHGQSVVDGKLECHFLGIRDLVDATIILDFLHDTRFDINNVSSFGSVVTGCRERVATQLQVP